MSGVLVKERDFKGKKVACDADDNTVILLDFGNNAFAYVHGTAAGMVNQGWGVPNYYGTGGSIIGTTVNGKPFDYPGKDKDPHGHGIGLLKHAKGKHAEMEEMHVFEDVMQLADWVREGVASIATAEHARHVVEIFEAAYKASETGQTQKLATTFTPAAGA